MLCNVPSKMSVHSWYADSLVLRLVMSMIKFVLVSGKISFLDMMLISEFTIKLKIQLGLMLF